MYELDVVTLQQLKDRISRCAHMDDDPVPACFLRECAATLAAHASCAYAHVNASCKRSTALVHRPGSMLSFKAVVHAGACESRHPCILLHALPFGIE
eukprot:1158274-Pelagomonas_calceolata.AAC.19